MEATKAMASESDAPLIANAPLKNHCLAMERVAPWFSLGCFWFPF